MVINEEYTEIKVAKLSPEEIMQLIEQEAPLIVDVRPENFRINQSYIKGAIHCPLVDLVRRTPEFPKDRPLLITDWAMKQSPIAAIYFTKKQFRVLGVLKGGIGRWVQEKRPTEDRPLPPPPASVILTPT